MKLHASEHEIQAAFVQWLRLKKIWHFAVPNALKVGGVKLMAYLKAEGLTAGVPDLIIPYRTKEYGSLAIEMKRRGGTVKDNQKEWHEFLRGQGYRVVVCYSADEAIAETIHYFNGGVNHV